MNRQEIAKNFEQWWIASYRHRLIFMAALDSIILPISLWIIHGFSIILVTGDARAIQFLPDFRYSQQVRDVLGMGPPPSPILDAYTRLGFGFIGTIIGSHAVFLTLKVTRNILWAREMDVDEDYDAKSEVKKWQEKA